jgi:long-chain fatty acid transport protein
MFISPSWSWMINDDHSIGVALNVAVARLKLRGAGLFANSFVSAHPGHVTDRSYDYEPGIGVQIGWLGHFSEYFSAGVNYKTTTWMHRFRRYKGFFAHRAQLDLPAHVSAGIALHPCRELVLSVDGMYVFWEDSDALRHGVHRSTKFGSHHGPGFGWENRVVIKAGAAVDLGPHLTLRAGYNYGSTPIHHDETYLNVLTLDTMRHHITSGLTWFWDDNELTAFYIHGFSHKITGKHNSIPALLGSGEANIRNHMDSVGISYGHMF